MARVPVSIEQLPKELARLERSLKQAIGRGARNGARRGRTLLVQRSPKDQGLLKAAWRTTADRPSTARTQVVAETFNDAPYAGVVEMGARPHPVSEEGQLAIYEWVKRHFGFLRTGRGTYTAVRADSAALPGRLRKKIGGKLGQLKMDLELVKVAEAIIQKIRKHGQRPTYFVRDSLPDLQRFAADEIVRQLREAASRPPRAPRAPKGAK